MRILERIFGITRNFAHEVIAIDVGTASLSAALAKKGLSSSIEVVSVLRYGMDFFASREGFDHQRRALYLLKTHIAQLMSDAHKALPGAKAIEISVSEPFFQQYRICKDFQRERPHDRIRRSELDEITAKLAGDAVRDLSIHSQSLRVVRSAMQKVRINGYELKDPIGYRGADLDIEFEVLLISGAFYEYLEEFRMRWFPRVALHYHSDPEMLEHALFASSSIQPPALLLDIGGEVTSIAIILEKKARVLCDPVFFGVRTLERRIAEVVRCDSAHAESLLRRYVAQTRGKVVIFRFFVALSSSDPLILRVLLWGCMSLLFLLIGYSRQNY